MEIPIYQIDAFADKVFRGNPAAVCPLDHWLDDRILQSIAAENNLAETAFLVRTEKGFHLRWFAPLIEVDLCGHATLASAYALFELLGYAGDVITFETRSGELRVARDGGKLVMDFPLQPPSACTAPAELIAGLGKAPVEILAAQDFIAVYESEADILSLTPDFRTLARLPLRGVAATAKGVQTDFVSRFFGPKAGVDEDPVTGSAHCELAPYWAQRLGKNHLTARQISKRGGEIACTIRGDRVFLAGTAVKYLEGTISVPL